MYIKKIIRENIRNDIRLTANNIALFYLKKILLIQMPYLLWHIQLLVLVLANSLIGFLNTTTRQVIG
jgi:hypothetical protein